MTESLIEVEAKKKKDCPLYFNDLYHISGRRGFDKEDSVYGLTLDFEHMLIVEGQYMKQLVGFR